MISRPTIRERENPYQLPAKIDKNGKTHKGGTGGSPYRPEFVHWGYRMALLGATNHEMGQAFGVEGQVISQWMQKHADFGQAIRDGRSVADALVAEALYKKATGYTLQKQRASLTKDGQQVTVSYEEDVPPDTPAAIYWLRTRRPDLWGEQPKITKKVEINAQLVITDPYSAFRALKDAS